VVERHELGEGGEIDHRGSSGFSAPHARSRDRSVPLIGESFELTDFVASRAGDVLAVRYLADATGLVDGRPYSPGPAPRLSVFVRDGKRWRIVAHANFNPLAG
jgi:hypothetical protein